MTLRLAPEIAELRSRIRHSAAHVMADVVTKMYPEAKLAIGPPTDDGFYYDFMVAEPFKEEDLEAIESKMREVIKRDHAFEYAEYAREEMLEKNANEPLKLEIINQIPADETISTYTHGDFEDLCVGPHVESTGKIPAFKLLSVAGAYWRGDEKRPMLQRIYGTAFETEKALDEHLERLEEARRRDHRVLGRDLDLYSIHDEIGPGLIIWHPKGARIRGIVEDFWKQEHYKAGYDLVYTPHIGRSTLWETSGHLDFYKDNMYAPMDMDGQDYYLRPMNCPFHIMYYKTAMRSYRDLPMRIGELGSVYRYERGGVLHGLLRVRGMTQDDAHIFCRPDQLVDEVNGVLDLDFKLLEAFGFKDLEVTLSTMPEKAVGDPARWEFATDSLRQTLEGRGIPYEVDEGGGAFYGPKIDVHIRDAIGRLWQCTTVQFDFNLPERFGITYIGDDGQEHQPYMVHRALLGSMERFMGVLIEHFGGAFPTWLAPVQATVIPIADRHIEYANKVKTQLTEAGLRVEVDARNERMNAKIRQAQVQKVPYMLVVGDREAEANAVAVRLRSGEDLGAVPVGDIQARLLDEVATKALE
ncbi:MAG: threonine--tRNA ligase [Chloroflexi bacterium]|nr:threonine--tRNA ligase [Chloroflexota bacterium]MCI0840441.1 threonine--tRNA ligase [Chloroflexota bacterium]MCI0886762.1 threonine--tRNA ligase [Chloroflexota bacterium]